MMTFDFNTSIFANHGHFDAHGHFRLSQAAAHANKPSTWFCPLAELGTLQVSGADAGSFLHSQLTNDIQGLALEQCQWAGYCSPKGRLLGTFLHWGNANNANSLGTADTAPTHYLQTNNQLLPALQKRLSMFVLRAKVQLSQVNCVTLAIGGAHAEVALKAALNATLSIPETPYGTAHSASAGLPVLCSLPSGQADGLVYLLTLDPAQLEATVQALTTAGASLVNSHYWAASQIAAGIPHLTSRTQDLYVPQMINFELVGGVNFKKGCYPGQEVVARSQYLGKLKRRMALYSIEDPSAQDLQAGMDIYAERAESHVEPVGTIVNIAPNAVASAGAAYLALLELPIELHGQTLYARAGEGAPSIELTAQALPYSIPSHEVSRPKL
jgi:folate-binding protein YgfZ